MDLSPQSMPAVPFGGHWFIGNCCVVPLHHYYFFFGDNVRGQYLSRLLAVSTLMVAVAMCALTIKVEVHLILKYSLVWSNGERVAETVDDDGLDKGS